MFCLIQVNASALALLYRKYTGKISGPGKGGDIQAPRASMMRKIASSDARIPTAMKY